MRNLLVNKDKPTEKHPNAGLRRLEGWIGLLFISPWIAGFLLLKFFPILAALGISFTDFRMLTPEATRFIGLSNYVTFLGDARAWVNLSRSVTYFLTTVPVEIAVALALAAIFSSERLRARGLLRTLFFMPSIIPAAAVVFIWMGLVDPNTGWLNRLIFEPLGLPPLEASRGAFSTMVAIWSIGPGFLIMYGAMQSVPREIHEAARVDGAGPLMRFVAITLPIISPAIFFSLVINLTSAFGGSILLDRGYLFSRRLSPMEGYINSVMFSARGDLGYASALAWIMFAVTMTITIALFRSAQRWVYFPEENTDETR